MLAVGIKISGVGSKGGELVGTARATAAIHSQLDGRGVANLEVVGNGGFLGVSQSSGDQGEEYSDHGGKLRFEVHVSALMGC